MKIVLSTIAASVLLLAPSAWAATAHDMPGMASMKTETFAWGHPGKASAVNRTIHIKAEDGMRFVPAKLTVRSGQTVKFVITNAGKLEHEFVLGPKSEQQEHEKEMQAMMKSMMKSGKMNMQMEGMHMAHSEPNEVELPPGTTKTLIWTFTAPGSLQYGCHEPGHYAAGMFGAITVVKAK